MEVKSSQGVSDRPSCDPWVTFLVIVFIILIVILVKLSGVWFQRQPQMKSRILTDHLSGMFEYLLKVKNTLKKLTVKFFQSMADEEKQFILKDSSAGKKTVLVFEPEAVQNGTAASFPHAIIHFPEKNETKNFERNKSNIAKEEIKSQKIHTFPDFNILRKNKTVGLWENRLNISKYKAKMQKPSGLPIKYYFPNFKTAPDKSKILGSIKSTLSPVKSKLGKDKFVNAESETENSSVRIEYNPENVRLLVEGFRMRLPLFSEKDKKKQRNSTSKPHWLDLESNILQNWIDACLEIGKMASAEEEEEIEPEMYISYNKKDFSKTFFSHPSLFPFAAVVRIFKLILQTTLILGVVILAFIVIAFAKVKETHNYSYIRDQITKTNTFQNLKQAFGAMQKFHAPQAVLHLQTPTSSCSSGISLQTILEDIVSTHHGETLYDWDWMERVYLFREGSRKFHEDCS